VDCDGTLRLFRVGTISHPFWHCMTSDGHCWSLAYQLPCSAAERLREWLRPLAPLVPRPQPLKMDSSSSSAPSSRHRTFSLSLTNSNATVTQPPTPRAVTLLFGHRKHKANVKKSLSEKLEASSSTSSAFTTTGFRDRESDDTLDETKAGGGEDDEDAAWASRRAWVRSGELSTADDWGVAGSFAEIQISEPPHAG
jgi:hypothetical protein